MTITDYSNKIAERNNSCLTLNDYEDMVTSGIGVYSDITDEVESKLDKADLEAMAADGRLTHYDVFTKAHKLIRN